MRSCLIYFFLLFFSASLFAQEEVNKSKLYSFAETDNGERQSPINIPGFIVKQKDIEIERDYLSSKIKL